MNAFLRLSLLIFEAALIIAAAVYFSLFFYARLVFTVIALALCVRVFASDMNFAYKNLYALLLVAFPCLGVFFYIFTRVGRNYRAKNKRRKYFTKKFGKTAAFITSEFSYPVCKAENFRYHADGEAFFNELFKAISRAEKFIFLQFFIVKESNLQLKLFDLLKRKAARGVEIKFLYDGFGAMFFERKLKIYAAGYGFEAKCFNPPGVVIGGSINNRHHGKIAVIDGLIGFVGGVNIGDEYVNETRRFGRWKDGGVSFCGGAVKSLTHAFLKNYGEEDSFNKYCENTGNCAAGCGEYINVFSSAPTEGKSPLSEVYLTALYNAKSSITASTPYLVPDESVENALISAVRRGVTVKIVIPEIPDKKAVYKVSLSYAARLSRAGVKIYLYRGGFIHAKNTVIDGNYVICGSGNLDYRSMYLHYETGVFAKSAKVAKEIESDITGNVKEFLPENERAAGGILRLFAPLM